MRKTQARLTLIAVVLAASSALLVGQAFGADILDCGASVTEDTRLVADITGCELGGVTIDADNVTLDLNGHAITGTGVLGWSGIEVGGHDGVTILNGTVAGFGGGGIVFWESDGNRLEGVTVSDNHVGVILFASSDNVISRNTLTGSRAFPEPGSGGDGIWVTTGSHRNLIERNMATFNDSRGMLVEDGSNDNVLLRNHVVANGSEVFGGGISVGITPSDTQDSIGNLIERNVVLRNTDYGILVGLGNTVTRNVAVQNGFGIQAEPGGFDGGGNVAAANGQVGDPQCENVVCLGPK